MYKVSRYNIVENVKDGVLIYNTFSGSFLFVDNSRKKEIMNFLSNPNCVIDLETIANFLDAGFIIPDGFDEFSELKRSYLNSKKSKDVLSIVLLASESCNFNCPYCFIKEKRGFNMSASVYSSVLRFIEKEIKNIKNLKLQIFGGEPLLSHRNNILFLGRLNDLTGTKINKVIALITNGYLLDLNKFKEYLDHGCFNFQITLDGYPSLHNFLGYSKKDRKTFEKIWRNIKEIKELKENFKIILRINFPETNLNYINEFIDFLVVNLYGDRRFEVYFRQIVDYHKNIKGFRVCSREDGLKNQFEYMLRYYLKSGIDKEKIAELFMPKTVSKWCDAVAENHYIIGADGLVFKCDLEIGNKKFACGKLEPDGRLIINYKTYHQRYSPYRRKKCQNCILLPICQGGCAYSYNKTKKCFYTEDSIRKIMRDFHYGLNSIEKNVC